MRKLLLIVLLSSALHCRATTFATDATDLWWNPNESGWGLNVAQQDNTLFLTFFVYATNNTPIWLVAPATVYAGPSGTSLVYSGPLYVTTGPWFGGAFNAATVAATSVGTATFTLQSVVDASLTYSVNGAVVTKQLKRQTWKSNSIAGNYLGASIGTYSGNCPVSGYAENPASIVITVNPSGVVPFGMSVSDIKDSTFCFYSGGQVGQDGQMSSVSGTYTCSTGAAGQFQAFEIQSTPSGVTARATASSNGCNWTGRIGGLRRGQ